MAKKNKQTKKSSSSSFKSQANKPITESSSVQIATKQDDNSKPQKEPARRPLAVQVIGLLLIVIGAILVIIPVVSGLINKSKNTDSNSEIVSVDDSKKNNGKGNIDNDDNGIDGNGVHTSRVDASTKASSAKADNTRKLIESSGRWRATNYVKGDIGVGKYEVKLGDTLWEISEAVYGSGFKWHKLLETNKGKVGYLPNGSQALIKPDQTLVIEK